MLAFRRGTAEHPHHDSRMHRAKQVAETLLATPVQSIRSLNPRRAVSFRVETASGFFKVFYCHYYAEAPLVHRLLETLDKAGLPVPASQGYLDDLLVTAWKDGPGLNNEPTPEAAKRLLTVLVKLHTIPLPNDLERTNNTPWADRLGRRLVEAGKAFAPVQTEQMLRMLESPPGREQYPSLLHLDLTQDNALQTPSGLAAPIDNEALCIGHGRAFDVWHCAESLYPPRNDSNMMAFIEEYDRRCPGSGAVEHQAFWKGIYWLKKALKAREKGHRLKARWRMRKALAHVYR